MQQALRYEAEYFDDKKRLLRVIFNETLNHCADAYKAKNVTKDKFQEMSLKKDDERYIRNMLENPISIVLLGNRPSIKARIVNYILGYELLPVFDLFDPDYNHPRRSVRIVYGTQRRHSFCIRNFELLEYVPSHTDRVVSFDDLRLSLVEEPEDGCEGGGGGNMPSPAAQAAVAASMVSVQMGTNGGQLLSGPLSKSDKEHASNGSDSAFSSNHTIGSNSGKQERSYSELTVPRTATTSMYTNVSDRSVSLHVADDQCVHYSSRKILPNGDIITEGNHLGNGTGVPDRSARPQSVPESESYKTCPMLDRDHGYDDGGQDDEDEDDDDDDGDEERAASMSGLTASSFQENNAINEMTTLEIVLPNELLEKNLQIRVAPDVEDFDVIHRSTFHKVNPIIIYCFERYDEELTDLDVNHLNQLRQLMPSLPILFAHIVDFDPTFQGYMNAPMPSYHFYNSHYYPKPTVNGTPASYSSPHHGQSQGYMGAPGQHSPFFSGHPMSHPHQPMAHHLHPSHAHTHHAHHQQYMQAAFQAGNRHRSPTPTKPRAATHHHQQAHPMVTSTSSINKKYSGSTGSTNGNVFEQQQPQALNPMEACHNCHHTPNALPSQVQAVHADADWTDSEQQRQQQWNQMNAATNFLVPYVQGDAESNANADNPLSNSTGSLPCCSNCNSQSRPNSGIVNSNGSTLAPPTLVPTTPTSAGKISNTSPNATLRRMSKHGSLEHLASTMSPASCHHHCASSIGMISSTGDVNFMRASENLYSQLREMEFFQEKPGSTALQGPLDRQQKRLSNGYYIINNRPFKCMKQNADYGLDTSSRFICHSSEFCYFVDFFRSILKSNLVVASTLLNEIHNQFIQYFIFSAFDMTWDLNYSIPKRLEYAKRKETELYMSMMGIANRKQEEIRQLIGETLEFIRDDILEEASAYTFSNPNFNQLPADDPNHVPPIKMTTNELKICVEEIQEFVFEMLNRAIAAKLISSVDVMRESFIGTLKRCLKSLEESRMSVLQISYDLSPNSKSASAKAAAAAQAENEKIELALAHLLDSAYSIEINVNTCNSMMRIIWERMRTVFCGFSLHWQKTSRIDAEWKRKVATYLIDNLCEAKLAKSICMQFRDKLKQAHDTFSTLLGTLETALNNKIKLLDSRRNHVRKVDAPLFARLALESTSFIDAVLYGTPELSKEIGRGQYGVVFSTKKSWAHYSRIAVKSIMICDDKHWNDLAMEFYYTRSLPENDRIVQIRGSIIEHNYNSTSSYVYLIMDRLPRDLYAGLKSGLDWLSRLQISLDVVHGLRFLHNHGLIHRDIKLKNVLLDRNNRAKITDLGFCKSEVMISGSIVGTPIHMAPEVFTGKYDHMVDVYAFGILFWYICAGSIELPQIFEQCHNKDHLWIAVKKGLRPEKLSIFDDDCYRIMEQCWNGDPAKRPLLGEVECDLNKIKDRVASQLAYKPVTDSVSPPLKHSSSALMMAGLHHRFNLKKKPSF